MTSHELFAAMPGPLAVDILEFSHTNDKKLYRAALDAVAAARKLRSVFLERQPWQERYAMMIASLGRPALGVAADSLLRNWLLKKYTAILTDFLDALNIKHEKGVVEELPKSVEDGALRCGGHVAREASAGSRGGVPACVQFHERGELGEP